MQKSREPAEWVAGLADASHLVVEAAARRLAGAAADGGRVPARAAPALLEAYLRLDAGAPDSDTGCWARTALLEAMERLDAPGAEQAARLAVRTVQVEAVAGGRKDTATGLRVAAAAMLANRGTPGALLDLAWLLFDFEPGWPCSPQERPFAKAPVRAAAARAIGSLGDPAGAAVLSIKLAFPGEEVSEVLEECMDALTALEEPRAVELLDPWLDAADARLVAVAATAMARAGGAAVIPRLVRAIDTAAAAARVPLVYALASVRANATQDALRGLTAHPDAAVRAAAAEILGD